MTEELYAVALVIFMLTYLVQNARLRRVTEERDAMWETYKRMVLDD